MYFFFSFETWYFHFGNNQQWKLKDDSLWVKLVLALISESLISWINSRNTRRRIQAKGSKKKMNKKEGRKDGRKKDRPVLISFSLKSQFMLVYFYFRPDTRLSLHLGWANYFWFIYTYMKYFTTSKHKYNHENICHIHQELTVSCIKINPPGVYSNIRVYITIYL